MKSDDDEVTTAEAAALLGVSAPYVRRLVLDGRLPARRVGQTLLLLPHRAVREFVRQPRGRPKKISDSSLTPSPARV